MIGALTRVVFRSSTALAVSAFAISVAINSVGFFSPGVMIGLAFTVEVLVCWIS